MCWLLSRPSSGSKMGLVVAGQHVEMVFRHVDNNSHQSNDATNEICLQDVVTPKREQTTLGLGPGAEIDNQNRHQNADIRQTDIQSFGVLAGDA